MAELQKALPTLLLHEGGSVNHPDDPGGFTSYGISLRFLRQTADLDGDSWPDGDINRDGDINATDIRLLTKQDAEKFYQLYFWDPNKYERIESQDIATKLLDFAVNMGGRWANRIAQRAVRATIGIRLKEDGIMGNKTLHAINMTNPDKLLVSLRSEAAGYYRLIAAMNPKLQSFLRGWLNRAYD